LNNKKSRLSAYFFLMVSLFSSPLIKRLILSLCLNMTKIARKIEKYNIGSLLYSSAVRIGNKIALDIEARDIILVAKIMMN